MMVKKTKEWWASQAHMYSRQVGELQDLLKAESAERRQSQHEASRQFQMAASTAAQMKRCQDMLETVVNELTKAQYEGKDEGLLADARSYLQMAVASGKVTAFLDYGVHAENIRKSGYNVAKLHEYTQESLHAMRKKWGA
jgi:hypothetical protein